MSKTFLVILGVVLVLLGIWGMIPAWQVSIVDNPSWYLIVEIIVGLIAVYVGATDTSK